MWRCLALAAMAYGCGHPALDGYRPGVLDRPLHAFYQQVNSVLVDGEKVALSLNRSRQTYIKAYMGRVGEQLRSAE